MVDEEYEILPHQLLQDLRYDVEALKKKLSEPETKTNELILEIESLKDSIHELTGIFQKALQDMKEDDPSKMMQEMSTRLRDVISQNEVIARGMVAISDKLEDFMRRNSSGGSLGSSQLVPPPSPQISPQVMGIPQMSGARMAPKPAMPGSMAGNSFDFPPPPPGMSSGKKRVGIFK